MIKEKEKQGKQDVRLEEEFDVSYDHLERAFIDFVNTEESKPRSRGLVNFASVTGGVMLVVVLFSFLQLLGLEIGPNISFMLHVMPLLGGLLVLTLGLGWFRRRKKRKKKVKVQDFPEFKLRRDNMNTGSTRSSSDYSGFDSYAFKKRNRLYRSRKDKKLMGVCGGLANYFGMDPTLVRIVFALGSLFYGSLIFVYFILGIVLKKEPLLPESTR